MGPHSMLYFVRSGTTGQHDATEVAATVLAAVPNLAYDVLRLTAALTDPESFVLAGDTP